METKYTVEELALKLKVSKKTILREIGRGKLHTEKVGRRHLISESQLNSYLEAPTVPHITETKPETAYVPSKKMPPEHIFQKEDDDCCGPCSLEMIYRLKGQDIPLSTILNEMKLGEKGECTYPAQLARHLTEHGLRTNLIISNSQFMSPAWRNINKRELIENVRNWLVFQPKNEWHVYGLHTLYYLEDGGSIELRSIDVEYLKKLLDRGSYLILALDEVWLWGNRFNEHKSEVDELRGKSYGHFVVVTGYEGDNFKILDPYPTRLPDREGSYSVEGQELLNAVLTWSATVLEVLE